VVTKRSGQAQTALISRRPATVERTRPSPTQKGSGQQQIKYESETGHTDSDSQTKRVESLAAWDLQARWVVREPSFPRDHQAQSLSKSIVCRIASHGVSFVPDIIRRQVRLPGVACSEPRCPDPGRERRKRAQKGPESATRRVGRFAGRKAIPNRPPGRLPLGHGRQSLPSFVGLAPRSGTRVKEAGTKGAGISDAARRASRRAKDNPNSPSWTAAVRSWSPKPSLLRRPGAPIRDAGEGNRHKGSRNQRRGASCESPRGRQSQFALLDDCR
jgi:hypothetical protein